MARPRQHRRTLALRPPPFRPLTFVVMLGRALGATADHEAVARVAGMIGLQPITLLHEIAKGTLANLPTSAVRTLMQIARELPNMPAVEIGDLAPLDPMPVKLMVDAVRVR